MMSAMRRMLQYAYERITFVAMRDIIDASK